MIVSGVWSQKERRGRGGGPGRAQNVPSPRMSLLCFVLRSPKICSTRASPLEGVSSVELQALSETVFFLVGATVNDNNRSRRHAMQLQNRMEDGDGVWPLYQSGDIGGWRALGGLGRG